MKIVLNPAIEALIDGTTLGFGAAVSADAAKANDESSAETLDAIALNTPYLIGGVEKRSFKSSEGSDDIIVNMMKLVSVADDKTTPIGVSVVNMAALLKNKTIPGIAELTGKTNSVKIEYFLGKTISFSEIETLPPNARGHVKKAYTIGSIV